MKLNENFGPVAKIWEGGDGRSINLLIIKEKKNHDYYQKFIAMGLWFGLRNHDGKNPRCEQKGPGDGVLQ